jgi:hypothetical protein
MIIRYKYGLFYAEKLYGWNKGKLYRLPQNIGKRFYGLLECKPYKKTGFYLGEFPKSKNQLESMTVVIDKEISFVRDRDVLG